MFCVPHKYRFYPTKAQEDYFLKTFGCVRVVYNSALAERKKRWEEDKKSFSYCKTSKFMVDMRHNPETPWLEEAPFTPLQQALRHLDKAYQRFFRKQSGYPKFKKKTERQSAEYTKRGFTFRDGKLKLSKLKTPLNVVLHREMPSEPSTCTVIREADGTWHVVLNCLKDIKPLVGGGAVGIDLGIKDFAVLSTGEKVTNHKHISKRARLLARLQRQAARKKRGSNNRRKANIRVARAYAKVKNARNDFLQKLSTRIIRENQTVCLETLNIKGMVKNRKLSKAILDCGWGMFVNMLKYKARWYGREVIQIDRWSPSTKTCCVCGTTGHKLSLSDREWTCPDCGTHHDRDVNAAKNILAEGLKLAAETAVSVCGENVIPCAA